MRFQSRTDLQLQSHPDQGDRWPTALATPYGVANNDRVGLSPACFRPSVTALQFDDIVPRRPALGDRNVCEMVVEYVVDADFEEVKDDDKK